MADTKLQIFQADGSTAAIDYRTESTNGDGRQVVVFGDPSSNNAVAAVQATDPASNTEGVVVRDVNTSAIAAFLGGSLAVYLQATAGTLNINLKPGTIAVSLDPGHELGSIKSINSTVGVYIDSTQGTLAVQFKAGTLAVSLDPGHELGTIKGNSNTLTVFLPDTGHELGSIRGITNTIAVDNVTATGGQTMDENYKAQRVLIVGSSTNSSLTVNAPTTGTFQVYLPDTGHELGSIRGINNSINVYLGATAGTLIIKPDPAGTYFVNGAHTASVFTVSGSTSTAGNNTLVNPSASYNFKIFAYSIQTTGIVSAAPRFTTGASAGATELWRPLITPAATTSVPVGANLAVPLPSFIFATGTNTTLSLYLDTGTLFHYSISYIKESS